LPDTVKIMPKTSAGEGASRLVAVLAHEGVSTFELGIAIEVFGLPGMGSDWYRVVTCSDRPGEKLSANGGVAIVTDAGLDTLAGAGTIIVPGSPDIDAPPSPAVVAALIEAHAKDKRIASICSGVFVLAAAGLLDGRRAAVHWANAEALGRRYPRIAVDANVLYVDEGNILTSAGRAAGLDLCLHIVRRDYGIESANLAARRLVVAPHRSGGQAQFIPRPVPPEGDRLGDVFAWARRNLDRDLSIDRLAEKARMSRRTLIRRCAAATGLAPGEWVLQARVAEACRLLEATPMPIEQVAAAVGLGSAENLRHQFRTRLRTTPTRYRSSFAA
jgi:AraC family transcriptional regulator, transcriptional activator FtrA